VRLTRAGSALVSRVSKLIPVLDGEVGQGLTDSEQHTMLAFLQRMATTLELSPGIHPHLSAPSRSAIPHPDSTAARARPPDAASGD
jgi:hypothetical protein